MKMSIYITLWGFYLSHLGYLQAKKYAWKIKEHGTLNITHLGTVNDLFNSIEIKYFGGDCSILLEFSQILDML